jgi:hypothetical protein
VPGLFSSLPSNCLCTSFLLVLHLKGDLWVISRKNYLTK